MIHWPNQHQSPILFVTCPCLILTRSQRYTCNTCKKGHYFVGAVQKPKLLHKPKGKASVPTNTPLTLQSPAQITAPSKPVQAQPFSFTSLDTKKPTSQTPKSQAKSVVEPKKANLPKSTPAKQDMKVSGTNKVAAAKPKENLPDKKAQLKALLAKKSAPKSSPSLSDFLSGL